MIPNRSKSGLYRRIAKSEPEKKPQPIKPTKIEMMCINCKPN